MGASNCTPDTEALRALLRRLHPCEDIDAAVDQLMLGQTSSRALPEMSVSQLSEHLPPRTAELVHLIPGIARATLRSRYPDRPIIGTKDETCRFLAGHFLGRSYEHCFLLLLKKNRHLINDQMIQSGTLDSVPFYTRNIVEAILHSQADAVVIAHNHPGGSTAPSEADISSTRALIEALQPFGVPLLDHIILTDKESLSIRETGYIAEDIWLAQPNSCPAFLKSWLNAPAKPNYTMHRSST